MVVDRRCRWRSERRTTLALYRHEKVSRVVQRGGRRARQGDLADARGDQVSTVVVIVTSLIAAVIIGTFDAAWSAITDLIYKV